MHVLELDDAQSEYHTYYIQPENFQMYTQNNELYIQIADPATCSHSYGIDNEPLFSQWFQQAPYLTQQVAVFKGEKSQ